MTRDGQIDFLAIAHALREEDVDAAINLGLLDWAGDAASAGNSFRPCAPAASAAKASVGVK